MTKQYFKVLTVHRSDLESRGVKNPKKITDDQMEAVANIMAEGIMESGAYWDALDVAITACGLN